ncbi:hypothetical protein ACFFN5_06310, partial [Streptomonospora salina]
PGAAALYGVVRLRRAAQDARWQDNLDQARDQVRETRDQLTAKAKSAKEKVSGADADEADDDAAAGSTQAAGDLDGRANP